MMKDGIIIKFNHKKEQIMDGWMDRFFYLFSLPDNLISGVGGEPDPRADLLNTLGEDLLGIISGDGGDDNTLVSLVPVNGGGNLVVDGHLERVENTVDLVEVAAGGGGVGDNGLNFLVGADEEDRADGQRKTGLLEVGLVQHSPSSGDLAVGVRDDGVVEVGLGHVVDILDPRLVVANRVDRETGNNAVSSGELGLHLGETAELGGTDGGEVLGVRAEESPLALNVLVPLEGTQLGLALEVRDLVTDAESSLFGHDEVSGFSCLKKIKKEK